MTSTTGKPASTRKWTSRFSLAHHRRSDSIVNEGTAVNFGHWTIRDFAAVICPMSGVDPEPEPYDVYGTSSALAAAFTVAADVSWEYRFAGVRYDNLCGMSSCRRRVLPHNVGRFSQRDPLSQIVADANSYQYVDNRPTTNVDPSGLLPEQITIDMSDYRRGPKPHRECLDGVRAAVANLQKEAKAMKEKGCGNTNIACQCCKGDPSAISENAYYLYDRPMLPGNIETSIVICEDTDLSQSVNINRIEQLTRHELVHAYDLCMLGRRFSCEESLCSEIRAVQFAGQCDPQYIPKNSPIHGTPIEQCVQGLAFLSLDAAGKVMGTKCALEMKQKMRADNRFWGRLLEQCWTKNHTSGNRPFPVIPEFPEAM